MNDEPAGFERASESIDVANTLLRGLQEERLESQVFQNLLESATGLTADPRTFTDDLVRRLKERVSADANEVFNNRMQELAARFQGTSGARSGPFAQAAGTAASDLASSIATGRRGVDIRAALARNDDLLNAFNLGTQLLQLQSQIPLERARLHGGIAPAFAQSMAVSPLQAAGEGLGAIGSAALGNFGEIFG